MVVGIRTCTGKTISLTFTDSDTVAFVKDSIQDSEGMPPDRIRLVFAKQILQDGRTLAEYGVKHGDILHLVLLLCG